MRVELFVSGSYLNPDEVPAEVQPVLVRRCTRHPCVRQILVETRPEYVTREALDALVEAAAPAELEVAIGLETADDTIRNKRIRKGFTRAQFEESVRAIGRAGGSLFVYILLKPLDTPEAEALRDAVDTARYVFDLGAALDLPTRVGLQPCFVAPGTVLAD
ncbi:MAG: hypothetical protein JRI25_26935, partial [Deltaproteobacteria bacterium]|nr:hypothetical protein [Deltaproteobacteria bacterium]